MARIFSYQWVLPEPGVGRKKSLGSLDSQTPLQGSRGGAQQWTARTNA